MELFIFARFHARAGKEGAMAEALLGSVAATREEEPGCLAIHAYCSVRDPRLFHIHSRWRDVAAFERHAALPRVVRFIERVEGLADQPLEITRSGRLGQATRGRHRARTGRRTRRRSSHGEPGPRP